MIDYVIVSSIFCNVIAIGFHGLYKKLHVNPNFKMTVVYYLYNIIVVLLAWLSL